ncbi:MAG: MoxR family ATPase [Actinobacteria bacterium]|nr:MoxR family ATPase [Actinomycetota bacterium]
MPVKTTKTRRSAAAGGLDTDRFQELFNRITANVNKVIHGKDDVVRLAVVALASNGHVLFEDVPGVGKSMLARALSLSMHASTNRIQCTPDMLPGDITGSSVIDTSTMKFSFQPGPVFTNILLVDEVNRATPKTQSALLESMAEGNVTIDGVTHPLPKPFVVLATQNPVEQAGTFPLPEAQLDRFLFKLTMGFPDIEAERKVVRGNLVGLEVETTTSVCNAGDILWMRSAVAEVEMTEPVETYLLEIVNATRSESALLMSASPRASIALARASRALAAADGRTRVFPEDVKALLRPILGHRILLTPDAQLRGETVEDVLERIITKTRAPLGVKDVA